MQGTFNFMQRLRLNTKLLLGNGSGFAITLIVGLVGIFAIRALSETAQQAYEIDMLGIANMQEAEVNIVAMGRSLRQMAMTSRASERAVAQKSLADAEAAVKRELTEGRKRVVRDNVNKKLEEFEPLFAAYSSNVARAAGLLGKGDTFSDAEATNFITSAEFRKAGEDAEAALNEVVRLKQEGARLAATRDAELANTSQLFAIGLLVFGLAGSIGFGLMVSASIRRPLERLRVSIQELAEGRLDTTVPHTGYRNEIGAIATSVQVLKKGAQAMENQRWTKQGLTEIDHAVQSALSFAEFGDALSARLASLLGLVYSALYVADAGGSELRRVGGYGCHDAMHASRFALGQGLVGQAALDRRQISLSVPEEMLVGVSMGLGTLAVRAVLISPLVDRDKVLAVLELGALQAFDSRKTAFVEALLPVVSAKMQILAGNVATRELLKQARPQPQEPETQESAPQKYDELEASKAGLAQI